MFRWWCASLLMALVVAPLPAREAYRKALADLFGPQLSAPLNSCLTCHQVAAPSEEAHEHNAFGTHLAALRQERKKAGLSVEITARLEAAFDADADGDTASNLIELLAGTFPGRAESRPNDAQRDAAAKARVAFLDELRTRYVWQPFDVVKRPTVPASQNVINPIDAFLQAEYARRGLKPRPEISRERLLRRVTLDLTGLPPTREELHDFLNDPAPNAYDKVVDRLLQSPRHGERWARHWMDVWRYSDYTGEAKEIRTSQPHIWRWRDWIIESVNRDMGYDRMIVEMLAGDEVAPTDPQTLRATGFIARNFNNYYREAWMQELVDHTSQAFLGVRMGCARCHDHMYDAITQREYYQMRAIFEPHHVRIDPVPGQPDIKIDGIARVVEPTPNAPTYLYVRGDDRQADKSATIPPGVPALLKGAYPKVTPIKDAAGKDLSTGRRLAFAQWIANRENPLTASVAVNHIWLRHFGKAIVPSVYEFGTSGTAPTHPALLDYLADELMTHQWSMKYLHRLIVTSAAYRMDSTADAENQKRDPDNRYLWQMPTRRLEAEVIRDQLLLLGGTLDQRMGGASIPVNQADILARRSLYFHHCTELQMELLQIFDGANASECYERAESIVPQQALALFNNALVIDLAGRMAARLGTPISNDAEFTRAAFEEVLTRRPTDAELARVLTFLKTGDAKAQRAALIHVLMNHHEFVTWR